MASPKRTQKAKPDRSAESACIAIGADAGGTKLALAFSTGSEVRYHKAPSVNLRADTPQRFASILAREIVGYLQDVPLASRVALCIGASGAGTKSVAEACRMELASLLNIAADQVVVTSDARIALEAAFPGSRGMLVIAGTGSGCYALDGNGELIRAGGWGPGLEDPGSGGELGRSAIKHLLSELEGREMDAFSRHISAAMGIKRHSIPAVLDTYYGQSFHAASLAPAVLNRFEAEDPVAIDIVRRQCASLARQCARLAAKLNDPDLKQIAVAGGLANRDSYIQALSGAIRQVLPDLQVTRIERAPVEGALSWALSMTNQG